MNLQCVCNQEMDDSVSHETELQCEYVGLWHALACKKGHGNVETTRSWSTLVTSSMLGDHALQLVLRSLSALVQEEGIVPGGFVGSLLAREDAEERRLQVLQEKTCFGEEGMFCSGRHFLNRRCRFVSCRRLLGEFSKMPVRSALHP